MFPLEAGLVLSILESMSLTQQDIRREQQDMRREQQDMRREQQDMRRETINLRQLVENRMPPLSTPSLTAIGRRTLDILEKSNSLLKFEPAAGGLSVLDTDENLMVLSMSSVHAFVDLICSKLQKLIPDRAVVSSEEFPWLQPPSDHSDDKQKPDVFIIHPALVESKTGKRESETKFGIPAHRSLYVGMGIIDFKLEKTNKALGELVVHVQNLEYNIRRSDGSLVAETIRSAFAHKGGILLLKFRGNCPYEGLKLGWTDEGGAGVIQDFFKEMNPTALVLNELLDEMKLNISTIPFLGKGGTGCVFRVAPKGDRLGSTDMALKVVTGKEKIWILDQEFRTNQEILRSDPDVAVIKASKFHVTSQNQGAGMLMEQVGEKSKEFKFEQSMQALISVHGTGYHHGDSRIANLLICGDLYKWCDLQSAQKYDSTKLQAFTFAEDIVSLLEYFRSPSDTYDSNDLKRQLAAELSKNYLENRSYECVLQALEACGYSISDKSRANSEAKKGPSLAAQ